MTTDPLIRDVESANRLTNGIAEQATAAADQLGRSVADLVEACDHLVGVMDEIAGRLIAAEQSIRELERDRDRRESYEQEQGERP